MSLVRIQHAITGEVADVEQEAFDAVWSGKQWAIVPGATNLGDAFVTQWKPKTSYKAGEWVVNPSGELVSTIADFQSGVSYDATKFGPTAQSGTYVQRLSPSGDTTGATDTAAINASLAANRITILYGGDFYHNAPFVQPSNRTLVLWEAETHLAAGSNCNIWQNTSQGSALDSNISIKGIGRARFDGNGSAQVRQNVAKTDGTGGTSLRDNIGIYPVRIDGFRMEDVQVGPTNAYAVCAYGITKGRFSRIRLEQDASTGNQDGIDLGLGCQDVVVEDITGRSGDDAVCIMAVQWWKASSPDPVPPAYQVGSALALPVQDITLRNIHVQAGMNLVRVLNDATATITRVHGHGLKNNGRSGIFTFGNNSYINTGHLPGTGSINEINFEDVQGMSPISANSGFAVDISTPVKNVTIRNLDVGAYSGVGTAYGWKAIVGSGNAINTGFTVSDVLIDGVHSGSTVTTNVGDLVNFQAGITLSDITLKNVDVKEANSITKNASVITRLTLQDIHVGTIYGNAFQSADTGYFENVRIDTRSGVTTTYGVAVAAKLGPNMPIFTTGDVAPVATPDGSRIRTDGTFDPNGGVDTTGGEWVANGTAWIKVNGRTDGWAQAGLVSPMYANNYYRALGPSLSTLGPFTDGLIRGGLLVPNRSCTLTEIGIEVTTAGSAGSVVRLGIYKINPTTGASTLVVDAGTIDGTSTGYKSLVINQKVNSGDLLVLVAAGQGAPTTPCIVRATTGDVPFFSTTTATTVSSSALTGVTASGVTGALAASVAFGVTTSIPRVLVKA